MVDVGKKPATRRRAVAEAVVHLNRQAHAALKAGTLQKGDALAAAQLGGIMAAKRVSDLIPLCHPLPLSFVDVIAQIASGGRVVIRCETICTGQTGAEMEALTGAAVAALTIYDMCKAVDRGIEIRSIKLLEKSGGKSGAYKR
jgi:cyclic pyranopterin monophosphate synthase